MTGELTGEVKALCIQINKALFNQNVVTLVGTMIGQMGESEIDGHRGITLGFLSSKLASLTALGLATEVKVTTSLD